MKKIFFSAAIALSLVALAASPKPSNKNSSLCANTITDTVPGKKDTTKKPIPDSIYLHRP